MSSDSTQPSEAVIGVHWKEEDYFTPPASFVKQAYWNDPSVFERFSERNFPQCFDEYADLLTWSKRWDKTLDSSNPPFFKWFVGGQLNASYNCVDRHLKEHRNKVAYYFVPEEPDEPTVTLSYQQLYRRVNEVAAMLRDFCGLKRGDRVTLHLPMTLDLPITMLACARLGVIHSQVFSGFSGKAAGDRVTDSQSRILITADGYHRGGHLIDHKEKADIAVAEAAKQGQKVDKVIVWRRHAGQYASQHPMVKGRDFFADEVLKDYAGQEVEPVMVDSTDTLFLMYTSGTTGKPKGAQHSVGGYLAYVAGTTKYIQDLHPTDVYWCMADIGWITGHSYIVYGPLALCATSVLYEGTPTYPDASRPWRIAEEYGVNIFHTSPTAVRALRRVDDKLPLKFKHHFKHMTTVGEPIEPESWRWYHDVIGKGEAVIVDTWWQTENGGFMCSTVPGLHKMKPGSAGPGLPGIFPAILDDHNEELKPGSGVAGNLCIRNPWPGRMLTVWGNDKRFVDTYYAPICRDLKSKDWRDWPYLAGDGAMIAADGYLRVLGRIDDVINVAGHRLGTKEIESACMTVPEVAEAAVVSVPDKIKGVLPEVYCSLRPGVAADEAMAKRISNAVVEDIGAIARPRRVWMVPDMPKTRSGKIMRRVLAAISAGKDPGDVTTLANGEVVEHIRQQVQGK
ncbi:MAG: acetate--CoA ligase [Nevskiaceae bacterium]|nr:MAG: acetate--CoA ligase [Nevskiaceae bacterium]TBR73018.1 MAG: acetate--CoA ligase [Nevskiaceae bacterium]